MDERNLSDSDVDKIVERLEQRMLERLHQNVGRGVLAMLWTWSIRIIIILAAYGAGASDFFKKWGL